MQRSAVAGTLLAAFGVVAYHVVSANKLAVGAYGTLAMLLAVVGVVSAPVSALSSRAPRSALLTAWAVAVLLLGAAPWLRGELKLGVDDLEVRLVGVLLFVAPLGAHLRSKLSAARSVLVLAFGVTLIRVGGALWLCDAYGLEGALLAALGAELFGCCVAFAAERTAKPVTTREAMGAQTSVAVAQSSDIVLGEWLMSAGSHGAYALGASVVRSLAPIVAVWRGRAAWIAAGSMSLAVMLFGPVLLELAGPRYAFAGNEMRLRSGTLLATVVFVTYSARFEARRAPVAHAGWLVGAGLVVVGLLWNVGAPVVALLTLALSVVAAVVVALGARVERVHEQRSHQKGTVLFDGQAPAMSVLIPSLNPTPAALVATVADLHALLRASGRDGEIVVVDDGSSDASDEAIAAWMGVAPIDRGERASVARDGVRVTLVRHVENRGKGAALATGLRHSSGEIVGMLDADGDIPPGFVLQYAEELVSRNADAVIGSKNHPGSGNENTLMRRAFSYGFQSAAALLLGTPRRDTQVGAKVFRREVFEAVEACQERGFLLDPELLLAAAKRGFGNVVEAPVTVNERHTTTTSALTAPKMLLGLVRLGVRARVYGVYAPEVGEGKVRADVMV